MDRPTIPQVFAGFEKLFPTEGRALDLACGRGGVALWLASRGMHVRGVDVSPVAIQLARDLLSGSAYAQRTEFEVCDLDAGLPPGPRVDLLLCCHFRDPHLYRSMAERVVPGGLLAVATLSEVDAKPSRFRAARGELQQAFAGLECLAQGEHAGQAWFIGRRRGSAAVRRA